MSKSDGPIITKAALIKQGDSICTKTDTKQRTALSSYEKLSPIKPNDQTAIERALKQVAFPPIAAEIDALEALGSPAGDEAKLEAIYAGLRQALQSAEANPSTVMSSPTGGPFASPDKLAAAYGFKACAKAL